ncbi:MAG: Lactose transport system permease protein LacF [Anaerolineales bacterium]|nr:Lactose transport system permease protein LacF [Anaerolineales bacterium]
MSPILPPGFVGLKNYAAVVTSSYFLGAVQNTLVFTVVSVPIIVVLGIASASILNQRFLGDIVLKPIVLLPWTIPAAISGVIWKGMFSDSWGAINAVLYSLHLIPKYIPWLNKPNLAMFAVIVAQVWTQLPFAIVLTLAAMQAIPQVLYESAAIDGASAWGRFRHITLPNIRAMLVIVILYETLMGLTTFDLTYSLTGGGPGTSTTLISYFTWAESFKMLSFGRGAALAIVIALTSLIFILGILQAMPKDALLGEGQE